MNRKMFYSLLLWIYLLSACTQSKTIKQVAIPTKEINPLIITSGSPETDEYLLYPTDAEGFLIKDDRTEEERERAVKAIRDFPASGYRERLILLYSKLDEMDKKTSGYYQILVTTNPAGDGWSMVLVDGRDGNLLVPASAEAVPFADLIVNPSAPLNSFTLVRISSPAGARVVFDGSGWPVVVAGDGSAWYNLGYAPVGWREITEGERQRMGIAEPTPTVEPELTVAADPERPEAWPVLTVDRLPEYFGLLLEYVRTHEIFPDKARNIGAYRIGGGNEMTKGIGPDPLDPGFKDYLADPDTMPFRVFAFAILEWEIPSIEVNRFTLVSQVWLDENDEPTIIFNYLDPCDNNVCPSEYFRNEGPGESYEMWPGFYLKDTYSEGSVSFRTETLVKIQEQFDLTKTKDLIYKWNEDQRIPRELNDKLMMGWF